jgi:hypothetical protein
MAGTGDVRAETAPVEDRDMLCPVRTICGVSRPMETEYSPWANSTPERATAAACDSTKPWLRSERISLSQ